MKKLNTVLFYVLGLTGLVVSTVLFTSQGDLAEVGPLPILTPPREAAQTRCLTTPL